MSHSITQEVQAPLPSMSRRIVRPSLIAIFFGMLPWLILLSLYTLLVSFVGSSDWSGNAFFHSFLLPSVQVGRVLFILEYVRRYFDSIYVIDQEGMVSRHGRVSLNMSCASVRYRDIREIRVDQSIMGRGLNFGTVLIGTASTGAYEVSMTRIPNPHSMVQHIWVDRLKRGAATDAEIEISGAELSDE